MTAGLARLGWSAGDTLAAQAVVVLILALMIRLHPLVDGAPTHDTAGSGTPALRRGVWTSLAPLGLVLLIAYIVDSTVSAWSTVYLHQVLAASLTTAPLAYAAYQTGTITGRASADHLIRKIGPTAVIRTATLLTAAAMSAMAAAPSWPYAIPAAGLAGVGVSALAPLCFASAGVLQPEAAETILARLNLFNYAGVISGAAASGFLGSSGHFRLAYAIPAALALTPLLAARAFTLPKATERPARREQCACRHGRLGRSGSVSVLVDGAAESVVSADVEVRDALRVGDRCGQCT
jgi:MFS family permease